MPTLASSHANAPDIATHSATNARENIASDQPNLPGVLVGSATSAENVAHTRGHLKSLGVTARSATDTGDKAGGRTDSQGVLAHPADALKLTIRIPALSTIRESGALMEDEPDPDEEISNGRRTFCPIEHREAVVEMMERHFCAHPLIPGYSSPTPEGIKSWAVKQVYDFCVSHDLPNLWAYLWENWYRRGRWELWARSGNPTEIPRLKTTMLVEGQ